MSQNVPKQQASTKTLKGYIMPRDVGMIERVGRRIPGTILKVLGTTTLSYATYQAAAHDTINDQVAVEIIERVLAGVINTLGDINTASSNIYDESDAITSVLHHSMLGGAEPTYSEASTTTSLVAAAYGQTEIDLARVHNNLLTSPTDTIGACLLLWFGGKLPIRIISDLIGLGDKPDFSHRIRCRIRNAFTSRDTSRKINLPKKGGAQFLRK